MPKRAGASFYLSYGILDWPLRPQERWQRQSTRGWHLNSMVPGLSNAASSSDVVRRLCAYSGPHSPDRASVAATPMTTPSSSATAGPSATAMCLVPGRHGGAWGQQHHTQHATACDDDPQHTEGRVCAAGDACGRSTVWPPSSKRTDANSRAQRWESQAPLVVGPRLDFSLWQTTRRHTRRHVLRHTQNNPCARRRSLAWHPIPQALQQTGSPQEFNAAEMQKKRHKGREGKLDCTSPRRGHTQTSLPPHTNVKSGWLPSGPR